jgi:hypothetical protein
MWLHTAQCQFLSGRNLNCRPANAATTECVPERAVESVTQCQSSPKTQSLTRHDEHCTDDRCYAGPVMQR